MIIKYNIVVTIFNKITNSTSKFSKDFETEITAATDALLYNNYHIISRGIYILDMFKDEIDTYCNALSIQSSSIEVDEFEIVSLQDNADVFFESENDNELSLKPILKCYIHPKNKELKVPELIGSAYDSTTIIWSWPNDEQYAHYLIEEAIDPNSDADKDKIIAQLPIGVNSYTETGLEPNTPYTRRLINYTDEQTSVPSAAITVMTETTEAVQSLEEYTINKNYDFTTNNNEKDIIEERLEAFHSGIGDKNDLKVYKQMDADFYQKFKAYFEITGRRTQKERRYDQVNFNYKICLDATETVEEQEGEVTFDLEAYPREWVRVQHYMYSTLPVKVYSKLNCTVMLCKPTNNQETVNLTLDKVERKEVFLANPAFFTFIVDASGSMNWCADGSNSLTWTQTPENQRRWHFLKTAMKSAANTLMTKAQQEGTRCYIGITVFGNTGAIHSYYSDNIGYINGKIDQLQAIWEATSGLYEDINIDSNYTSWDAGVNAALRLIDSGKDTNGDIIKYNGEKAIKQSNTITLFFTDGYPNRYDKGSVFDEGQILSHTQTAGQKLKAVSVETWCIDMYSGSGNHEENGLLYTETLVKGCENAVATSDACIMHITGSNAEIGTLMSDMYGDILEGTRKIYYEDDKANSDSVNITYDIDTIVPFEIETDIIGPFEFNEKRTPVSYASNEQRAIITESSKMSATKMVETSIYDLLLVKIQEKLKEGYQILGDKNGFLISNLFIKDTYSYGDEDVITDLTFDEADINYGLVGSIDVFTDMSHTDTSTLGDDVYLVTKNNYLYISGFTDAIIYDGTRFGEAELNAYNHQSEVLVSKDADYRSTLTNRRVETINFKSKGGKQEDINSVITLLQKDKDIYLTGLDNKLKKEGDILTLKKSIPDDLIGYNDTFFQSPVLNYRFNIEDPDAKTPIYEILPKDNNGNNIDINSEFLHVVLLNVYYARNVFVTNTSEYIKEFGDNPICEHGDPKYSEKENFYKWTKMEWKDKKDNGWYVDNYIWFQSKKHTKDRPYYDELPGQGIESFYGTVNGRYDSSSINGKKELRVDAPQFNIPTTVLEHNRDSIRIYAVITELHPSNAFVYYKWEHPYNKKDSVTQKNGDYIYFNSDTLTYKDVDYYDIITTINEDNQELFNHKTTEFYYTLEKPETIYEYSNYYLNVTTNNGDVIPLKFPTEIEFDKNTNTADITTSFKGVVNATSKWSPRIHNGYYYLNQHEYFAYSEFDVQADFDTITDVVYKKAVGFLNIGVTIRRKAAPAVTYNIMKNTRAELIQDENQFVWINGSGLTLKPYIDGEYYKAYKTSTYYSPVIMFENVLTKPGKLNLDYDIEDESSLMNLQIRYYIVEDMEWSDWKPFTNNTNPSGLSSGYQLRIDISASTTDEEIEVEDYLCCYLDWKDEQSEANLTNIVTITDHMTTGPDDAKGEYISKIFDYGYENTELMFDMYDSNTKDKVQLYIGYSNNESSLLLENIKWINITKTPNSSYKARYFRYKIVIPAGEKLYWLHRKIKTLKTTAILPYIKSISMSGEYKASDIVTNFMNTESFEVTKDGKPHKIVNKIMDLIGSDVLLRGYKEEEIEFVSIACNTSSIQLDYDNNINQKYPLAYLNSPIYAATEVETEVSVKNSPYIFVKEDIETNYHIIDIIGTPQQYCPISVIDEDDNAYIELYDTDSFVQSETFNITNETKYVELKTNRYDPNYFFVRFNGEEIDNSLYKVVNHLLIFNEFVPAGTEIVVEYCILYSFFTTIDRKNNKTIIYLHPRHNEEGVLTDFPVKCKVYFETNTKNNKFTAEDLSFNPIYRTDYKGFVYLTDDHTDAYKINIYCNPKRIKANGYDKVDLNIEVVDIKDNPVISKPVYVDCQYGILINSDESFNSTHVTNVQKETDINGVVHLLYESAYNACTDTITVKVVLDDGTQLQESINIINE